MFSDNILNTHYKKKCMSKHFKALRTNIKLNKKLLLPLPLRAYCVIPPPPSLNKPKNGIVKEKEKKKLSLSHAQTLVFKSLKFEIS